MTTYQNTSHNGWNKYLFCCLRHPNDETLYGYWIKKEAQTKQEGRENG